MKSSSWRAAGLMAAALILSVAVPAQKPAPAPQGTWNGTLAGVIPVVLHVRGVPGHLSATLDSPKQGAFGMVAASVTLQSSRFSFTVPSIGASYSGQFTADTITGTFTQHGAALPLVLRRGAYHAAAAPPFVWPAGVRQIAVTIPLGPGAGQLAGAITEPATAAPAAGWPGAVILAGSGPTDRNGDNPLEPIQTHPYEKLAAYLSSHGVAVLRFDKRGLAGSAKLGAPRDVARYATDARWAALRLAQQPGVNPHRVALVGHSLGSTLALIAAHESTPSLPAPLAAIVSLEGAGRPMTQLVIWQYAQNLAHAAPAERRAVMARVEHVVGSVANRQPVTMADAGKLPALKAFIAQRPFTQSFLALDPPAAARHDHIPTLIVQGGKDTQVTAALDAQPLAAAIPAGTPHAVRVFPDMVHMLMDYAGAPGPGEQALPAATPLDPGMLQAVLSWIRKY